MRTDYIMKVIEQFVQAIIAIVLKRKAGNHKEAIENIQTASRCYLRADINLLLLYSLDQIVDHFKDLSGDIETQRCVLCAELMHELASIYEADPKLGDPLRLKMISLHLYTMGIPKEPHFQKKEYFDRVAALIEELKDQTLPEMTLSSLRSYEEFIAHSQ